MSKSSHEIEIRDDVWRRVEALAQRRGVNTSEIVQAALVQLFSRKKPTQPPSAQPTMPVSTPKRSHVAAPKPAPARRPSSPPAPSRRPPPPSGSGSRGLPRPGGSGLRRLPPRSAPAAQSLYLWCEGAWYEVNQDEFVIGRGQKYSDLAIRDANISRRHVAIVRRNGAYYMMDLGSTNGVEFHGTRVDNHLIREGSIYHLCEHELRFSFTPPG